MSTAAAAAAYAPSALRVLFLSPTSSPAPSFSLCTPAGTCGPAVSPPVTALGGGQWAADVSLPSPSGSGAQAGGGQWVLRMQTDQGAVFSSPFSVASPGTDGQAPIALPGSGTAPSPPLAPTAGPTAPADLQALQTLVLTGTPSLTGTGTGSVTSSASCTASPCPSASPTSTSALNVPANIALPIALALCLPLILAMCLFLLHFCRRRRRHLAAEPHEDCIFPPSPPLRAIERLESLSRPLPPLVSVCELTPAEQEKHDMGQDLEAQSLSESQCEKKALEAASHPGREKDLPPPPPAYTGITRKRVPDVDIDLERALRAIGRAISDSALVRLGSFRARLRPAEVERAESVPALPAVEREREVVRKPPPVLGAKRVSSSLPPAVSQASEALPYHSHQLDPYASYDSQETAAPSTQRAPSYYSDGSEGTYATAAETPSCPHTPGVQAAIRHQMAHNAQEEYFPPPAQHPAALSSSMPRPPFFTPVVAYAPHPPPGTRRTPALPEIRSPTPIQLPQLGGSRSGTPAYYDALPSAHSAHAGGYYHPAPAPAPAPASMPSQPVRALTGAYAGPGGARATPASLRMPVPACADRYTPAPVAGTACDCAAPMEQEGYPLELLGAYETPMLNGGHPHPHQHQHHQHQQYQPQQAGAQQPQQATYQQHYEPYNEQLAAAQSRSRSQSALFSHPPPLPTPMGLQPPRSLTQPIQRQPTPQAQCACSSHAPDSQHAPAHTQVQGSLYGPRSRSLAGNGHGHGLYDVVARVVDGQTRR
ncbi:hypothetical protein CALCODRAFT_486726 [Calocera cornea HHB12733]|uniref:Uncharacterized protein n=1 Tax=Calocera cornea HHB12733 TaxID=1353952 RepID=A0A165DJR0_9BASI|nr:hypothetical protein CALCODRAFT_486726 [Calocera cornea HHB12733]